MQRESAVTDQTPVQDAGAAGRVVMVEDHPLVLQAGAEMLRDAGFEVVTFETADEALGALGEDGDCDLLFTDIVLPGGMDGLDLAREVRARRPDLPILLTTGWADRAREPDPLNLELIGKPYRQSDLIRKVCDLLGRPDGDS